MKVIAVLLTFCALNVFSQEDENIPTDTRLLLKKLETFEKQELEKAQKKIQEKREAVAKALEGQLEHATKSGDLDGALSIRKWIATLRQPSTIATTPTETTHFTSERTFIEWITSRHAAVKDANGKVCEVQFGSKSMKWKTPGHIGTDCEYSQIKKGEITAVFKNGLMKKFIFDDSSEEFTITHFKGVNAPDEDGVVTSGTLIKNLEPAPTPE